MYCSKTARLYRTHDGKWRIAIMCGVSDPEPYAGEPVILGATATPVMYLRQTTLSSRPSRWVRRIENAERTASRAQHLTSHRQKLDRRFRKPGSKRWAKAQKRAVRNKRRAADICHTVVYKASCVMADAATHAAAKNINMKNMAKSAKGIKKEPGKNVAQKPGLNRFILS